MFQGFWHGSAATPQRGTYSIFSRQIRGILDNIIVTKK